MQIFVVIPLPGRVGHTMNRAAWFLTGTATVHGLSWSVDCAKVGAEEGTGRASGVTLALLMDINVNKRKKVRPRPLHGAPPPRGVDRPNQPDSNEQSGSTGRNTDADKLDQGKDTGQDRYGQSGYAGPANDAPIAKSSYRKTGPGSSRDRKAKSNRGSGRVDHEPAERRKTDR